MNETSSPNPPARQLQKKVRDDSATLPLNPEGASEKNWLDGVFKKFAYHIVIGFGIMGVVALLTSYFFGDEELKRDVYYFFIFVGAGLAAIFATWRGRQSEQQIRQFEEQLEDSRLERQNSRFERAVEMATDIKNRTRRASGFRILAQVLLDWGGIFDDTTKKNIEILDYLVSNSFKRTKKQEEAFMQLYDDSKISFGLNEMRNSDILFTQTHKPDINVEALRLWIGIVNWNMRKQGTPADVGIYSSKTLPNRSHRFIFSGGSLGNLQFFVEGVSGRIIPSNQSTMADFKGSGFILVDMHGATVDYVDFSESHFTKINDEGKSEKNCKMSCVGANFTEANFIDCNFRGANFKDASFVEITTIRVIFDEANLTDCNFKGANLGGASFVGTDISGSDFRLANNLTKEQFLQGAYWIMPARPKFPSSFPPNFADDLSNRRPESKG